MISPEEFIQEYIDLIDLSQCASILRKIHTHTYGASRSSIIEMLNAIEFFEPYIQECEKYQFTLEKDFSKVADEYKDKLSFFECPHTINRSRMEEFIESGGDPFNSPFYLPIGIPKIPSQHLFTYKWIGDKCFPEGIVINFKDPNLSYEYKFHPVKIIKADNCTFVSSYYEGIKAKIDEILIGWDKFYNNILLPYSIHVGFAEQVQTQLLNKFSNPKLKLSIEYNPKDQQLQLVSNIKLSKGKTLRCNVHPSMTSAQIKTFEQNISNHIYTLN